MKVLLICPKFPFDINKYFNLPVEPYGGWIDGMLSELINYKDIEISYLVFNSEKTYDTQSVNGINYLYINHNDNNTNKKITNDYDVYHIFGIDTNTNQLNMHIVQWNDYNSIKLVEDNFDKFIKISDYVVLDY